MTNVLFIPEAPRKRALAWSVLLSSFAVARLCPSPMGFQSFPTKWDASGTPVGCQSFLLAHLTTIMREVKKCPDSDITRRDQD